MVSTPCTRPPGASSRTAWDSGSAKAGLRQVVSRLPNPPSETGALAPPVTRWIGGSAAHPADRVTAPGAGSPPGAEWSTGAAAESVPAVAWSA
ncbi:hypothetical protein [Streptomyces sp. NPDC127084]|uniref:hypothetical protein n=1 Tax=Streptomyces sp. NPDC127084 TaxID=3347133 RepID=UPI003651377C